MQTSILMFGHGDTAGINQLSHLLTVLHRLRKASAFRKVALNHFLRFKRYPTCPHLDLFQTCAHTS